MQEDRPGSFRAEQHVSTYSDSVNPARDNISEDHVYCDEQRSADLGANAGGKTYRQTLDQMENTATQIHG